ncbi:hypothetical protein [Nannocystis punicea]|uniref:Peptidase family M23 n=1 Tax=Nannocystis punicea TaxID=2995304 RepID=A0ABY7HJ87_9BACT|nr:hypothetical protein [Nannocystis poenicansa]WAS99374.1 hypothetical protein O0S08_24870 [Nannocystis poenicansa]
MLLALGFGATAHAYPVAFPARGDSLPSGAYFRATGHTGFDYGHNGWGIDFHAAAHNGTQWTRYESGTSGTANGDALIFGAPLYAPEDGEIIACWRTAPNKPAPGVDYDFNNDGTPDSSPMSGGNHLQIRNADGDYIVYLAHMDFDSIPSSLCPLPTNRDANADGWPDSLSKTCSLAGTWDGMVTGTILPTPVPVKKGDFLGRVGHSGASSGPHLHMHVKPFSYDASSRPCEGPSEEIKFVEGWEQLCETTDVTIAGWDPLAADNPLEPWFQIGENEWIPGRPYCFMPDGIGAEQDHNDYGVAATDLHFTTHSSGDLLVYQSSGALRLRSYKLETGGTITDQDTVNEGSVLDTAVTRPRSTRDVVVAIRGSNGDLKHIPYTVSSTTGAIVRQVGKELSEPAVFRVETTKSPAHDGYVAAIEDSSGNLKVIDYHVDSGLNITRDLSGTGSGGAIDDVAITTVSSGFDGVVTAELTTGGLLVLRSFEVPAAGGVTWADTYTTILGADSVRVDTVPVGLTEYVVTSVQLSATGTLRLDTWEVDGSGQITWVDTISAGDVSAHDATPTIPGGDLVSAMRDDADNFRMIGWRIDPFGALTRHATRGLSAVTDTAIVASLASGGDHLVAARTDTSGELHLFSYGAAFMSAF